MPLGLSQINGLHIDDAQSIESINHLNGFNGSLAWIRFSRKPRLFQAMEYMELVHMVLLFGSTKDEFLVLPFEGAWSVLDAPQYRVVQGELPICLGS